MIGDPNRRRSTQPYMRELNIPDPSEFDFAALRARTLARLQEMMRLPRYATGTDLMGVWTTSTVEVKDAPFGPSMKTRCWSRPRAPRGPAAVRSKRNFSRVEGHEDRQYLAV